VSDDYASITLLEVEKESIQTQIIALHLQSKVVSAEIAETTGLRDKEQKHSQGGHSLLQWRETQGTAMLQDDERRH
jgi:streptomycin 6-kinase